MDPAFSSTAPNFQFQSHLSKVLKPVFSSSFAQPRVCLFSGLGLLQELHSVLRVGRQDAGGVPEAAADPKDQGDLGIQY